MTVDDGKCENRVCEDANQNKKDRCWTAHHLMRRGSEKDKNIQFYKK